MERARRFEGKKFIWDGVEYPDETTARSALGKYASQNFETRLVAEDRPENRYFVFTRRVVTEIKIEGAPPA